MNVEKEEFIKYLINGVNEKFNNGDFLIEKKVKDDKKHIYITAAFVKENSKSLNDRFYTSEFVDDAVKQINKAEPKLTMWSSHYPADYTLNIVAVIEEAWKKDGIGYIKVRLLDTTASKDLLSLISEKVINSVSMRFYPVDYEVDEETGMLIINRGELLGIDFVDIPGVPEAVIKKINQEGLNLEEKIIENLWEFLDKDKNSTRGVLNMVMQTNGKDPYAEDIDKKKEKEIEETKEKENKEEKTKEEENKNEEKNDEINKEEENNKEETNNEEINDKENIEENKEEDENEVEEEAELLKDIVIDIAKNKVKELEEEIKKTKEEIKKTKEELDKKNKEFEEMKDNINSFIAKFSEQRKEMIVKKYAKYCESKALKEFIENAVNSISVEFDSSIEDAISNFETKLKEKEKYIEDFINDIGKLFKTKEENDEEEKEDLNKGKLSKSEDVEEAPTKIIMDNKLEEEIKRSIEEYNNL